MSGTSKPYRYDPSGPVPIAAGTPSGRAWAAAYGAAADMPVPETRYARAGGISIAYHAKPVVFLDIDNFWPPLAAFLDHAVEAGVLLPDVRALFRTAPTAAAALDAVVT